MSKYLLELAKRIDAAIENKDASALLLAISDCETRLETEQGVERVDLHYFIANAYAGIFGCKDNNEYRWGWQQTEGVSELFALRNAISEPSFELANVIRKYQVRTNLAGRLSSLGRPIEAIEQWDKALVLIPNAAMASGNRASGIWSYSNGLYDYGHAGIFLNFAKQGYSAALANNAVWDSGPHKAARQSFSKDAEEVATILDQIQFDHGFNINQFSLGDTPIEQAYRDWCLNKKLFLNPLNDVTRATVAANDILHLPSHKYSIDETPRFPAYYNLLKQEYVTARYRLYKSLNGQDGHFIDKDVLLLDNADAAEFGYHIDELKTAFRSAYAILDKIAVFLNDYYSLGLKIGGVNFRGVWQQSVKGSSRPVLRSNFIDNKNWFLRGLYFLSKDLFDPEFKELAEPDAMGLALLRNKAEHRFLSLTHYDSRNENTDEHTYITTDEFFRKAMRMLKTAREAMIYLSLAMHREEAIRAENKEPGLSVALMPARPILRPWDID